MTGKIVIEAVEDKRISVEVDLCKIKKMDKFAILDALGRALELNDFDKSIVGFMFTHGGLESLPFVKETIVVDGSKIMNMFDDQSEGT